MEGCACGEEGREARVVAVVVALALLACLLCARDYTTDECTTNVPPDDIRNTLKIHTALLQHLRNILLDRDFRAYGLDHLHDCRREILPVLAHAEIEKHFSAGGSMLD